jgi:Ribbon-helix-helix protein, copG family
MYNFRLEDEVVGLLDRLAAALGINRSRALRQSVAAAAALLGEARRQTIARFAALRKRYGDDATLTVVVSQREDGAPLGHALINGKEVEPEGVHAVPYQVKGGKVVVFLNVLGEGAFGPPVFATLGNSGVLIPEVAVPLGELPWPPDPRKGLVIPLSDLDAIIEDEPTLREPIEV